MITWYFFLGNQFFYCSTLQWGSDIRICSDFKWSIFVRFSNGLNFEWSIWPRLFFNINKTFINIKRSRLNLQFFPVFRIWNLTTYGPFEIQPSKSPDLECFRILNGRISDSHCIWFKNTFKSHKTFGRVQKSKPIKMSKWQKRNNARKSKLF